MTYGNLAYKYDYREDTVHEKQSIKVKKENKKRRKSRHEISYFRKIASVVIVSAAAIFMIVQFIEVNETLTSLNEAKAQYEFEESVTSQKTFELEQSIDLAKIEQEATTRLGMQRPERHQIVYIDVKQDDVTEKTANEVEGFGNRFSSLLSAFISNIVEFFSI